MFLLVGILLQFVPDRDVYTILFVLLRGVVSPCIVSGVVHVCENWNYKSVQVQQLRRHHRSPSSSRLLSQTVILSQPENQQKNHDMAFKQ